MKLFFLGATGALIYQMRFNRTIRGSYDRERDTFRYELLVVGSLLLAPFVHEKVRGNGWGIYCFEVLLLQPLNA